MLSSTKTPIEIRGQAVPHPGILILIVSACVPALLGSIMLSEGQCTGTRYTGTGFNELLCASPPFGASAQTSIAIFAGVGLLFEAFSGVCKYLIEYSKYRQQQHNRHASTYASAPAATSSALLSSAAEDADAHPVPAAANLKPYSFFQLTVKIFLPYLVGPAENLFFTFGSLIPLLERYTKPAGDFLEKTHIIDGGLTARRLQQMNEKLNKVFVAILYTNAFVQTSGLDYYAKLVTVIFLVAYVYLREYGSIQTARLIRQQINIRDRLSHTVEQMEALQGSLHGEIRTTHNSLLAEINAITQTELEPDTPFIGFTALDSLMKRINVHLHALDTQDDLLAGLRTLSRSAIRGELGLPARQLGNDDSYRFFKCTLPRHSKNLIHSCMAGIGLIIVNLFLPNLIRPYSNSTADTLSSILLAIATFMPLNGLTDYENELWGFHDQIRGHHEDATRATSCLAFFVVNLPKLQGLFGGFGGVGMSQGNTQIVLVCEAINMSFAAIRSLITLPVSLQNCLNPTEGESSIGTLTRVL